MSGQKFAKWAVSSTRHSTFANWLHQRRKQRQAQVPAGAEATDALRWVEAVVGKRPRGPVIQLPLAPICCVNPCDTAIRHAPNPLAVCRLRKSQSQDREFEISNAPSGRLRKKALGQFPLDARPGQLKTVQMCGRPALF
jgi:hypothetical protein